MALVLSDFASSPHYPSPPLFHHQIPLYPPYHHPNPVTAAPTGQAPPPRTTPPSCPSSSGSGLGQSRNPPRDSSGDQGDDDSSFTVTDYYVDIIRQHGSELSPGFHFTPLPEQLVGHFLLGKINGTLRPLDVALVKDCDLFASEPWEIWDQFQVPDDVSLFLFTKLRKKSVNGKGSNISRRVANNGGTWHGEDSGKLLSLNNGKIEAVKKHFTYRNAKSPHHHCWLLTEYSFEGCDHVVCELRKKGSGNGAHGVSSSQNHGSRKRKAAAQCDSQPSGIKKMKTCQVNSLPQSDVVASSVLSVPEVIDDGDQEKTSPSKDEKITSNISDDFLQELADTFDFEDMPSDLEDGATTFSIDEFLNELESWKIPMLE